MAGQLAGKHILIVEDEYFIASDLKHALEKEEAIVVGPVGDLARALALAASERIDAALLDVNLDGAGSFPVADRLAARSVPYVFVTGYDGWALPEPYRAAPWLAKPIAMARVLDRMSELVRTEAAL